MRHCVNETVKVYQSESKNLAKALRKAAKQIEDTPGAWHNLSVDEQYETGRYLVTLYVHN